MLEKIYNVTDLGPGDGGKGGVVHSLAREIDAAVVIKRGGARGLMVYAPLPVKVSISLNGMWLFGENVKSGDQLIKDILSKYANADPEIRLMSLERMESDLLLYRLLHKGYSRLSGQSTFETSPYKEMDGDCPFYDYGYRRIATMLYAKYVLLPKTGISMTAKKTETTKYQMFLGGIGSHRYRNMEECNNG